VVFRGLLFALLLALTMSFPSSAQVLAADPSPQASPVASPILVDPLDPRAGEGANKIGSPLLALVVVLVIGTIAIGATVFYVRMSNRA
jgi:hypothetical protein